MCNKIPPPPKLRTPTKNNTVLPRIATMITPCKSSTSTVASPKRLRIAMNYENAFSSENKSPKHSVYISSDYDKFSSRKNNSPRRIPSVAMNKSPLRQINSPTHSPIISEKCSSREVDPPQRSSTASSSTALTTGLDKSGKILI